MRHNASNVLHQLCCNFFPPDTLLSKEVLSDARVDISFQAGASGSMYVFVDPTVYWGAAIDALLPIFLIYSRYELVHVVARIPKWVREDRWVRHILGELYKSFLNLEAKPGSITVD